MQKGKTELPKFRNFPRLIDAQHAVAIKVIEEDIQLLDQLLGDIPASKKKDDASEGIRDRVGTREIRKAYKS